MTPDHYCLPTYLQSLWSVQNIGQSRDIYRYLDHIREWELLESKG